MKIPKKHISFFTIFLILPLLLSGKASAVELNGVSLGPTIIDQELKPGEYAEATFTVQNKTEDLYKVQPYVQDYNIENGNWNPVENPDPKWSPMAWSKIISFPEKLGSLEQGQITVGFTVPKDAEFGEHVTYFSVRFIPADSGSEQKITVASEIRSIVYISVTDPEGKYVRTESWETSNIGCGFWQFGKPSFNLTAMNTGNVHLATQGKIEITDLLRNQKTELDLPLVNILPGDQKGISVPWKDAPFFGYYEAVMTYGYSGTSLEQKTFHFVTIPLASFLGLVIVLGGIISAIILYIRRLKKRLAALESNKPSVSSAEYTSHDKGGENDEENLND